jgi:hypothetical protein
MVGRHYHQSSPDNPLNFLLLTPPRVGSYGRLPYRFTDGDP